jgi:predicted HicB family RNase H-like nuclease
MNNYIEYKGYRGIIDYSDQDSILYGKIMGIDDLVTFEGTSVEEIKLAFFNAVDDYLKTCKELGKNPEKEFKGFFNVRLSEKVHKLAAIKAQSEKISLNKLVDKALRKELDLNQDS